RIWRLVRIKPEVIHRAEANRVGVLILRKSFGVPRYRIAGLSHSPWSAAITLIVKRAVVCPAGMLWRRMKSDIGDDYSRSNRYAEGLNAAIKVLVVQRVFVVPDSGAGVTHLEAHEPNAIVSRIRLNPIHHRASPRHDTRLLAHGGANG